MNNGTRRAHSALRMFALLLFVTVAAAAGYAWAASAARASADPPQDVIRLESRISQIEQRITFIETSVRSLEQQTRLSGVATPTATPDVAANLLRADVDTLRRRLAEAECGLAKLDERTLTAAAREARRRAEAGAGDPCRLDPNAPLRLSARP